MRDWTPASSLLSCFSASSLSASADACLSALLCSCVCTVSLHRMSPSERAAQTHRQADGRRERGEKQRRKRDAHISGIIIWSRHFALLQPLSLSRSLCLRPSASALASPAAVTGKRLAARLTEAERERRRRLVAKEKRQRMRLHRLLLQQCILAARLSQSCRSE